MKKTLRTIALGIGTAAASSVVVIGGTAPAQATPFNCTAWRDPVNAAYGVARCENGTGTYRVGVVCYNGAGQGTTVYGPWRNIGVNSRANCPGSSNAASAFTDV